MFVFATFLKFSCEKLIHGASFLAHAQDIVGIVVFSRSCFRPEVSLSIVKCNVSHVGQSDRDRKWKITFNQ